MSAAAIAARRRAYARAMVAAIGAPDPALLAAFAAVPREAFMPPGPWTILYVPGGTAMPSKRSSFAPHHKAKQACAGSKIANSSAGQPAQVCLADNDPPG